MQEAVEEAASGCERRKNVSFPLISFAYPCAFSSEVSRRHSRAAVRGNQVRSSSNTKSYQSVFCFVE